MQAAIYTRLAGAVTGASFKCFATGASRRHQAGRAGLFSSARPAALLCLLPLPLLAAGSAPEATAVANALLGSWLVQLGFVLGLLVAALKIYDHFRPKPPLYQQYAPILHDHAEAMRKADDAHKADLAACRAESTRECLTIRQEMGGMTAKLESAIDSLRNTIGTQNSQMLSEIKGMDDRMEERVTRLHHRIDPLAERVASNKQAIEQHLADERIKAQFAHNADHHGG